MKEVSREMLLLCDYNNCKNNDVNVEVFLESLLEYFENSRDDIDKNIVLNVLMYLKNGE